MYAELYGSKGEALERRSKGGAPEHRSKGGAPSIGRRVEPPSVGRRAEPLSVGQKAEPPSVGRRAEPPSMGRIVFKAKPPSVGRIVFKAKPPSVDRIVIWGTILYCLAPKAQWLSVVCCQRLVTERKKGEGGRKSIHFKDRIDAAARHSMVFRRPPLFWGRIADTRLLGLLRG
jgi:hypothetical protein